MKKIKMVSLFSGIGAFERALENLNIKYELINYCEIDKYASYSYSILHDVFESLNLWDVTKIDINSLKDFDLLTHGSPCQSFSLAGKGEGGDEGSGTKSSLMWYTVDIIKKKMPKYVIWENVAAATFKNHKHNFEKYLNTLEELGYNSYWDILNARDYGTPQARERVFVVSIRKDIDKGFNFPKPVISNLVLKDFTEDNIEEKYYCKGKEIKELTNKFNRDLVKDRDPSKLGLIRAGIIDKPNMRDISKRVFSDLGTSPTLLTGGDSIPKIVQCRVRRLTPLECWRVTSFTDEDYWKVREALEYRFYNGKDRSDSQMYKMAGNSIVVSLLEHIFKELFK